MGPVLAQSVSVGGCGGFPVIEVLRTRFARCEPFSVCEGFRMPAADERSRALRRPAYENLQGRKPRWGNVGGAACIDPTRTSAAWQVVKSFHYPLTDRCQFDILQIQS